jgi:DNA-binding NarL/FixJ family response regulator
VADDVRVLIADDQAIVRDGLAGLLGLLGGITVVGTAVDGAEAIDQARAVQPDVVLMDLNMPLVDGVAATRAILADNPRTRVVVLTTYSDDRSVFDALQAGARGFLTKDAGADEISHAILTVAAGEAQFDPTVQRRLLEALAAGVPGATAGDLPDALTAREVEVLVEIAAGHSNLGIAQRLVVSEATIKTHVNHLLAKTGSRDRAQLVSYAYRHRLAVPWPTP